MAELEHLEKMGRELKCPICLSLFGSAVSLTCNHVFCNGCIVKSMKSDSTCPVCKVPFQRREVRPAPHMDNLVSIYKSMENASGFNILVTQNASPAKPSDAEIYVKGGSLKSIKMSGGTCNDAEKQQTSKRKRGKRTDKTNQESSSPTTVKSSFPTKKRVQVSQHLPDISTSAKRDGSVENHKGGFKNSAGLKDISSPSKKVEVALAPFFWLRDEDEERDSSQTAEADEDLVSPPILPSFSDIKDSEDQMPSNGSSPPKNPELVVEGHGNVIDLGNEMYEWTQRPLYPEILTDAAKTKVPEASEIPEFKSATVNEKRKASKKHINTSTVKQGRSGTCNKVGRKAKCAKVNKDPVSGVDVDSNHKSENSTLGQATDETLNSSNLKKSRIRREKTASLDKDKQNKMPEVPDTPCKEQSVDEEQSVKRTGGKQTKATQNLNSSNLKQSRIRRIKTASLDKDEKNKMTEVPDTPCKEQGVDEEQSVKRTVGKQTKDTQNLNSSNLKKSSIRKKKTASLDKDEQNKMTEVPDTPCKEQGVDEERSVKRRGGKRTKDTQNSRDFSLRSKQRKLDMSTADLVESTVQIQSNGDLTTAHTSSLLPNVSNDRNTSRLKVKANMQAIDLKPASTSKCDRELRCKGVKNSSTSGLKDGLITSYQESCTKVSSEEARMTEKIQLSPAVRVLDGSPTLEKPSLTKGISLQRCQTLANKIQCAFCHSSEDSEASGEMVHYENGKPVSADYSGGTKIIHSHKNCTEWAPNVFFEDETAINLEAEIARSRRIKCCCCGVKGASLGCCEKSCRKSFHVTCAKAIPEIRWDADNFVILCPLHTSSKLPCEDIGSVERRKTCSTKKSQTQHNQVGTKHDNNIHQNLYLRGSLDKLVLCCSALTVEEKEIVSEFQKVSGVTVPKKWEPNVTHVIASTNENGACKRTVKVLMGILEGKWILSIDWVKACIKATQYVGEEQYEITSDIYGIKDGPRLGRQRFLYKQQKLFHGLKFYLIGDYVPSYKKYLQDLVVAAGGTILHRKPISDNENGVPSTFVIYNMELPNNYDPKKKETVLSQRRSDAEGLASLTGAIAVNSSWVLNSIAACRVQHV